MSKGFKSCQNLFCQDSENKKTPVTDLLVVKRSLTGILCNLHKNVLENFVGEGSSPFSCRKYLRSVNSVFQKIYAHNWLYTAVCGHNIFFVSVSWQCTSPTYLIKTFYTIYTFLHIHTYSTQSAKCVIIVHDPP